MGEWHTVPRLWHELGPLAREKRRKPTLAEQRLCQALRRKQLDGRHFRRQHALDRFIVDFCCSEAKLVIEVDGPIHDGQEEHDAERQTIIKALGFRVLRFTNEDVLERLDVVLQTLLVALAQPS